MLKEVIFIVKDKPPKDEHDLGYKSLLSKKNNFLHLLRKYIGAKWVNEISEDDLMLMDKSFILPDYKDKESDIIYRLRLKGKDIFFYVLLELQSSVDFTILFRLLLYMTELLRREFNNTDKKKRESKNFKLPPVIPIILYNGKDAWTAVRSFKEYLSGYQLFGKNLIDFEYLLLDLNRNNEEFILSTNNILDNIFALDQDNKVKDIVRLLKIALHRLQDMEQDEQVEFFRWLKHILLPRIPKKDRDKILESINRGGEDMLQYGLDRAFDNERKKGRKEGRKEGIEKGRKESKIEIAKKLLGIEQTVEQIVQITELLVEEVMEIKAQLKL